MTNVNAERLALRETDAVKAQNRDERRPSFEPHIRQADVADSTRHTAARSDSEVEGDVAQAPIAGTPMDDQRMQPLASVDSVFGEGAKIYPQGLAVVGYLSMLPSRDPAALVMLPLTAQSAVDKASAGMVVAPSSLGRMAATIQTPSGALLPDITAVTAPSDQGVEDGVEPMRVAFGGAEMTTWLMRRLSFSGYGETATLRLRDYRLVVGDERALADRLLAIAHENGWPVARIVVNGREIWCRPGTTPSTHPPGVETHGG